MVLVMHTTLNKQVFFNVIFKPLKKRFK